MKFRYLILLGIIFLAAFFRFKLLATVPAGLYIDEVSIGTNAYSILTTGHDEHGVFYPLFFQAFGEYKMPVTIYLTSLSFMLFGKTEFALRFPSAFLGTLSVLLLYFFVSELFRNRKIAMVASLLFAITPLSIQFSRGNFEANIALFFYLFGGLLFLYFLKNKRIWLFGISLFSLLLTMYTYNGYKLIAPITVLIMILYSFRTVANLKKQLITFLLVFIGACLPIITGGNERFLATSAFSEFGNVKITLGTPKMKRICLSKPFLKKVNLLMLPKI